jgi:hypothetical protein
MDTENAALMRCGTDAIDRVGVVSRSLVESVRSL